MQLFIGVRQNNCLEHFTTLPVKKMKFSIKDFFSEYDQTGSFSTDQLRFTKEILNGKVHFLMKEEDLKLRNLMLKNQISFREVFGISPGVQPRIFQGRGIRFLVSFQVSWIKGTLIKISSAARKKGLRGKSSQFFLLDTLKIAFQMRNLTHL